MLRYARFALVVGLSATMPVVFALDPPRTQQNKQDAKNEKKQAEPAKKDNKDNAPADNKNDGRLDRRNSRMKERNREIDGLLNKSKN